MGNFLKCNNRDDDPERDKVELTQHIELLKKTQNDNTKKLDILKQQMGFLNVAPQTSVTRSSLTNSQTGAHGVNEGDTKEDIQKAIVNIERIIAGEQKEIAEKTKEIAEKTKEIAEKTRQVGATTSPNGTASLGSQNSNQSTGTASPLSGTWPRSGGGGNRGGRKLKTKTKGKRKRKGKFRKKRKTRRNKNKKTTRKNK